MQQPPTLLRRRLFVFLNHALDKERDDAPKNQQLVFHRLPRSRLHNVHGATGWAANTIAFATESSAPAAHSRLVDFQLCVGRYSLPDLQKCQYREQLRLRLPPGNCHEYYTRVALARATRRHSSFHHCYRHIFNDNPGYDRSHTIRTTACSTLRDIRG